MAKNDEKRITVRLSEEDYDRIKHFAKREDTSVNQFIIDAANHYADWILKDFDVPTAEVKRLNQLIESMNRLTASSEAVHSTVINAVDSIYNMTLDKDLFSQDKGGDE